MSNSIPLDLDAPGTFLYTPERALKGDRLTQFGLTLRDPENRAKFLNDEVSYMQSMKLTREEIELVTNRDWTGLLNAGGHLQSMLKVSATLGGNLWDIGAHNTGLSISELQSVCPRYVSDIPKGPK